MRQIQVSSTGREHEPKPFQACNRVQDPPGSVIRFASHARARKGYFFGVSQTSGTFGKATQPRAILNLEMTVEEERELDVELPVDKAQAVKQGYVPDLKGLC
ncbi:hypothetical protein PG994_009328 [Apiospora phragmitis]|uniref:Uncharacterized protein n=1 Tax=Apiospora phragmitis TaxID=2905665 RepID=A0ABR1ULC3_9PEZI